MTVQETITEMDQLNAFIDEYCLIRKKLLENLHLINRDLELPEEDVPLSVMAMISQLIEISINLFEYNRDNYDNIKDELWDRVNVQERMVFVLTLSCFEYISKLYYNEYKAKLGLIKHHGKEKKRVSLRDILKLSNNIHVIDDIEYNLWEGLLEFRNCIVHNNAFSSTTKTYVFPSIKPSQFEYPELNLKFEEDKAIEGSLLLFPHLLNWTIDSIKRWIINTKQV